MPTKKSTLPSSEPNLLGKLAAEGKPNPVGLDYETGTRAYTVAMSRAAGGFVHVDADFTLNILPDNPRMNGVISPQFTEANAAERIESVLRFARQCGQEIYFKLGPSTQPADLGRRLEARGLKRSATRKNMGLDLTRSRLDFPLPEGVRVFSIEDFSEFLDMPHPFYGKKPNPRKRSMAAAWGRLAQANPRRLWVSAVEQYGHFAGSGVLFVEGEVATGFDLAILESMRRQGLGAALMAHLGRIAIQQGACRAVLNTSVMGMKFYPVFGFTHADRIPTYRYTKALMDEDAKKDSAPTS